MKTQLLQGRRFLYNNENYCIEHESDDFRGAEVWHEKSSHTWLQGFKIMFNGELVHCSKTFVSMNKRLNQLIIKWNLELSVIE